MTALIRREVEKLHMAQREGSYLNIIRTSSMIEDAARKIGWAAVEFERKERYFAS